MEVLELADWRTRAEAHAARVDAFVEPHLARRDSHSKHPVEDFLFTYYSHRPAQLRRWHPGAGTALAGDAARERLEWRDHVEVDGGVTLDVGAWLTRRGEAHEHVRGLLEATSRRPQFLGCFGLHECDRKSTRLSSSHTDIYRMPSS